MTRSSGSRQWGRRARRFGTLAVCALLALSLAACSTPGAIAPSTIPVPGKYVQLGGAEEASSCGLMLLVVPVKRPQPVADLIDDMIKNKGGDALIEVSSQSYFSTFLLFTHTCVEVRGKVVKFSR
jgi:hypothetical protein